MGESLIKLKASSIIYIWQLMRSIAAYHWRFRKCGKRVIFGRINRIIGAENIEIGDYCSFGNNLRLEAVTRYGGGVNLVHE